MRIIFHLILMSPFIGTLLLAETSAKKWDHALVMTGQGMNAPLFVGAVEGMITEEKTPNVIIAGCGASYAAALVNAEPETEKRRRFLLSQEYHALLKKVTIHADQASYLTMLGSLNSAMQRNTEKGKLEPQQKIPTLFAKPLLNVPQDLGYKGILNKPFSHKDRIRVIIVCTRVNFAATDVGQNRAAWQTKNKKKLYSIEYFTDADTAKRLKGFQSPIAALRNGTTPFNQKTLTRTDATLARSARASVADPFLMAPSCGKDGCYVTGAGDHYPVELADYVADTVSMTYSGKFSYPERVFYADAFGLDIHARQTSIWKKRIVDYWIDLSDVDKQLGDKFSLHLKVDASPLAKETVSMRVPSDYGNDFRARVEFQLDLGKERAIEAMRVTPKSMKHIRKP